MSSKLLQICRHTDKDDNRASQAGLDRFFDENLVKLPESVTDVFCGSFCARTTETALAAVLGCGITGARVHVADKRLGSDELFVKWVNDGLIKDMIENECSMLAATKKFLGDGYADFVATLMEAVRDMFAMIYDEGHGLAFNHSPLIEMIAEAYGQDMSGVQLQSCEGIMLVQHGDTITVSEILKVS